MQTRHIAALAFMAVLALPATTLTAQESGPVARYTALAVNMESPRRGLGASQINFVLNRWSTDEEESRLMTILLEQGNDALLREMETWPDIGSIAPAGSVGFDIRYARWATTPDGIEHVTMITNRPMSFSERWVSGRSTDYPFLLVQIENHPDGKSTGSIIVAAQLFGDKVNRTLVVDTLTDQPVLLQGLEKLE